MKVPLVDAVPFRIKKSMKSVMMHASKRILPLWAPASELTLIAGNIEKFERDYEMESFDGGKKRQEALWQNFINCDGHLKKFEERSSQKDFKINWRIQFSTFTERLSQKERICRRQYKNDRYNIEFFRYF